jgi:adhesin transport system membrane fusion protein
MADLISLLPNNTAQRPAPAVNDVMADPMLMCLAMAAKLLDRPVHMQVLRAGFALDERGRVPLAAYPDLAHKHGLMAAWSRIKINEVPAYVLPVLMPLMDGRACVVRAIEGNEPLVKQGVMSEVELLRLRRQQSELMGQRAERQNRYLTDANNELVRVASELSQTKENASAREDALKRTTIRSPMKGVVKNVQVTTVGGVIQAGQPILEIVPTEDEMLVEAYVKPSEVAFLKVGQKAVVKLTAYDFNKYGGLDGVLEHLSPDTLRDERQKRPGNPLELEEGLYRIMIRVKEPEDARNGLLLTPTPGMTATVEIRTGQKSVLEYLFRPLQNVSQALRER